MIQGDFVSTVTIYDNENDTDRDAVLMWRIDAKVSENGIEEMQPKVKSLTFDGKPFEGSIGVSFESTSASGVGFRVAYGDIDINKNEITLFFAY